MGKEAKRKGLYFIAERPEEKLKEYPVSTMQFLADIPDRNGGYVFTTGIVKGETLHYIRLNLLIEGYLLGRKDDTRLTREQSFKMIKTRSKKFFSEFGFMVCKLELGTGKFSVFDDAIIRSCFKKVLHRYEKKERSSPIPNTEIREVKEDYYGTLNRELNRCFGKYQKGSLAFTFLNSEEGRVWNVERDEKGYFRFGPDMGYNALLAAKLIRYFREGSVLCVRVCTDQSTDGIPLKELYVFILMPDGTMDNMDYRTVEKAYNTDHRSGKKMGAEKNVVYCDLQNNKLPSFDIE